jgi:hypothetical protein
MGKHIPRKEQPLKAPPHSGSSPVKATQTSGRKTQSAKATTPAAADPTHEQIATRAYEIWLQNGCQEGQDIQNWLEAESQLHGQHSNPQTATNPVALMD